MGADIAADPHCTIAFQSVTGYPAAGMAGCSPKTTALPDFAPSRDGAKPDLATARVRFEIARIDTTRRMANPGFTGSGPT